MNRTKHLTMLILKICFIIACFLFSSVFTVLQNIATEQLEALKDLGVMRLASRISELKRQGYPIDSKIVTVRNRFEEDVHIKRYMLREQQ